MSTDEIEQEIRDRMLQQRECMTDDPSSSPPLGAPPAPAQECTSLLEKAVADRDARPWRYYQLDHAATKPMLEQLADKVEALTLALAQVKGERDEARTTVRHDEVEYATLKAQLTAAQEAHAALRQRMKWLQAQIRLVIDDIRIRAMVAGQFSVDGRGIGGVQMSMAANEAEFLSARADQLAALLPVGEP